MNSLLLDTCTLIDWASNPRLLSDAARIAIADGRSQVFVSAASAMEIVIKVKLGKLDMPTDITSLLQANRFVELAVRIDHAEAMAELPLLHKDPFDRLLVAQARSENLTLVTSDQQIQQYDVAFLAA